LDAWLDPSTPVAKLTSLLKPPSEDWLDCYPVEAKLVNSDRVDQPECVKEIDLDWQALLRPTGTVATENLPFG
jgi:putative SOS response-associated peptidase YedK